MATGDIKTATVLATAPFNSSSTHVDGWVLELVIEGRGGETLTDVEFDMDQSGTYDNDLSDISNAAVVLTLTSEGYSGTTLGTTSRTVYGTRVLEKLYPNNANLEVASVNTGADLAVYIALSDYIFADDTSITVDVAANFCRRVTGSVNLSNAASSFAVTNSSTIAYSEIKPVAVWNIPHKYNYWDPAAEDFTVSVCAAHGFPKDGEAVAAVKFTITDGTNTASKTVTASSLSTRFSQETTNGTSVIEYAATFTSSDVSALSNGDCEIQCEVYPHIGDAGAVLDSGTTRGSGPARLNPLEVYKDNGKALNPPVYAYVNPGTAGASPAVSETRSSVVGDDTQAYANFQTAVAAIAGHNNSNGRGLTASNGYVIVKDGSYANNVLFAGTFWGTAVGGATWCTVEPETSTVTVTSGGVNSSDQHRCPTIRMKGITFNVAANIFVVKARNLAVDKWLLFEDCTISDGNNNTTFCATWDSISYLNCDMTNMPVEQDTSNGTDTYLIRACSFDMGETNVEEIVTQPPIIGSKFRNVIYSGTDDTFGLSLNNSFVGFSQFLDMTVANTFSLITSGEVGQGIALVQTVLEATNVTTPCLSVAADSSSTGASAKNIIIQHNTVVGQRWNIAYNDTAANGPVRSLFFVQHNIAEEINLKTGIFATDGTIIGNQNCYYAVGWRSNVNERHASSSFDWAYDGIHTFDGEDDGTYNVAFTDDQSGGAGMGDYTLATPGVAAVSQLGTFRALNWDLAGTSRSTNNYAGAYTVAPVGGGGGGGGLSLSMSLKL